MCRLPLLALIAFSASVASYPAYEPSWTHRSILYFAPSEDKYVRQFLYETLTNECALKERDVVTLVMTHDGFTEPSWLKLEFDVAKLAKIYRIDEKEHTAILIGKDGEEKYRWGKETDWSFINELIDSMPMRQREMRLQGSPCSI
ncbi:DUF4174 domain-containing protein [Vibrio nigripulchritudo]|uniref:DUF4174 domain-containing protein n=1 Tax=Vibrio nigripulchritudo TaxID=28173 RepID=UPI0003B21BFC|nr:DUF4174 domain-containing protein [Vibrio nigripulchritudo]CCN68628.1 conserved hypothetical protein [Vibrio nigripulchritudo SFn118]